MKNSILFTLVVATVLHLEIAEAVPTDKEAAATHFQNGLALLKTKNYRGAITEFEASIELYESKSALFNLANCYQAMHRYPEALATFDRLERTFAGSLTRDMKDSVRRHRATLMALLGELKISVDRPGAQIRINGRAVGPSPLEQPLLLGPGEYEVAVSLAGYQTFTKKVRLTSGRSVNLDVALDLAKGNLIVTLNHANATVYLDGKVVGTSPLPTPLEPGLGEHVIKIAKPGFITIEKSISVSSADPAHLAFRLISIDASESSENTKVLSNLLWTGMGLTIASGALTGAFAGLAVGSREDYDHYNDLIANNPETHVDAAKWLKNRNDADDDYSRNKGMAWGFGIGTGALAIASGVIFIVRSKKAPEHLSARVVPGGLRVTF